MQQKLSQIPGVGQVFIGGSSLPAVRVDLNPTQLNSYGLGLQDVRNMLSQQNANVPKGQIWDGTTTADILANDQLLKPPDYKPLIVATTMARPSNCRTLPMSRILSKTSAPLRFSTANRALPCRFSASPTPISSTPWTASAQALPSAESVDSHRHRYHRSRLTCTTTIRSSVREIERSLLISISLVILVVLCFCAALALP